MVVGVGIDVCEVSRFAASLERVSGLAARLFDEVEADRPPASLAARFAAKEALAKALGAPAGMKWRDARVRSNDLGQPYFEVMGTVLHRAQELGITRIVLSMTHDAGIASAVVVAEGNPRSARARLPATLIPEENS
ncbi:holo-ACP synthase [Micrococcales bacterium 31B]|nr:holo-ACP synthase [Micrococcales bacterium 31B]